MCLLVGRTGKILQCVGAVRMMSTVGERAIKNTRNGKSPARVFWIMPPARQQSGRAPRLRTQYAGRFCQCRNLVPITNLDGVLRRQPGTADAGHVLARQELRCGLLRNTAGRAERHVSQRTGNCVQHADTPGRHRREQLQLAETGFARGHHFRRRHHARQQRQAAGFGGSDQRCSQTRRHAERCTGVARGGEFFRAGQGADADDGVRHLLGNRADRRQAVFGAQGDFQHADTACHQRPGQWHGVFQFVDGNHGDDCRSTHDVEDAFHTVSFSFCNIGGRPKLVPPSSAALTFARKTLNNSRPMPVWLPDRSALSVVRLAHSASDTSASRMPASASRRIISPVRTKPKGPPAKTSGVTWIAAGTLPEAPDMRPSVTSATWRPLSCRMPSAGVSACNSGMPLARGPWKVSTAMKSLSSSPALKAFMNASCEWNTMAGACTARCSCLTAETLITERPRLPCNSLRPPSAENGLVAGRSTLSSPLSFGVAFHVSLPSSINGSVQCARKLWPRMVMTSSCIRPASISSRNTKPVPPAAWK